MQRLLSLIFLMILMPIFAVLYILVKLTSRGPFIFKQKRMGKDKKIFTIYKIRTMVENAEELKHKIKHLNEDDGPTFKIKNDPRYTRIGKFLSKVAIDELPQLFNVVKGEMSFVGPRPLPVDEAEKVPKKYYLRFSVLPGMTSTWVIKGAHKLSFDEWMMEDLDYVAKKSVFYDSQVITVTIILIIQLIISGFFRLKPFRS